MFVVVLSKLFSKNFRGMALYPFIFLKDKTLKDNEVVLNHERIHLRQQLELLIIPFYVWYAVEFFIRWIQFGDRTTAYYEISFEREAYAKEGDLHYLKNRRFWSNFTYL